jgi:DNA-binding transcriptional MerR regulator/methylmalonyl-CoA mutase cobalamin-binding subunit
VKNKGENKELKILSIGDVARASGISVFTLRMWERRYGHPTSVKLASGHRRFSYEEVERLRLVKRAVDAGHKASQVVSMPIEKIRETLKSIPKSPNGSVCLSPAIAAQLQLAIDWDDRSLLTHFESDWRALGPVGFVNERATQFLYHLGEAWANGTISVAHEHFASGVLENFLLEKWRAANESSSGEKFVVSSFEGEEHAFGLHMCSVILTATNNRVIYLGTSMPDDEIVTSAVQTNCQGVCISVSKNYDPKIAIKKLKYLRKSIAASIPILVGGQGAPAQMKGVLSFGRCQEFYDWLSVRASGPSPEVVL